MMIVRRWEMVLNYAMERTFIWDHRSHADRAAQV